MTQVRVVDPSGNEKFLTHVSSKKDETFDKQTVCRIVTTRTALEDVSLIEGDDFVYIRDNGVTTFGGVLRETMRTGEGRIKLICDSFERLARDAEPAPANESYNGVNDSTVITDAIDATDELSAGTIDTIQTGLDFTFHHASQALKIRDVRKITRGEIRYNPNRTVDYVQTLGSNRTEVISPANQNVTEFRVTEEAGEPVANHLRVINTQGETVDVVDPDFDPQNDREKWRRAYFTASFADWMLSIRGFALLEDLSKNWVKIDATLTEVTPQLGDEFPVEYPEKNIDTDLRVTEITTVRNSAGVHYECVLSNRTMDIEGQTERIGQLSRSSGSSGGSSNTISASGSVTLSDGSAVVDTGVSETGATFMLALGVVDPDADVKVAGRVVWDDSDGTYKIEIVEDDTSVGDPTVNYDVERFT